jgi:hypothetical protein
MLRGALVLCPISRTVQVPRWPETRFEEINGDLTEEDFWPGITSAYTHASSSVSAPKPDRGARRSNHCTRSIRESPPHETRGDVARRTNIEIDALQLLRLEFHLVGPTDELCILNLKNCFGLGGSSFRSSFARHCRRFSLTALRCSANLSHFMVSS